jgi:two-component system sensor histidine kinase SenX3
LVSRAIEDALAKASLGRDGVSALELHQPARRALSVLARKTAYGTVIITEDVSERMQIDAVRRDFVANVSHELRTPVGALSVLAETLMGESDLDTVRRVAGRMTAEADRAVRLIEDLLDLSRVESPSTGRHEPVRLDRVIANAVSLVEDTARAALVSIDVNDMTGVIEVKGDERQLVSAVRNLLDNAVKYSSEGGSIRVEVHADAALASISVADTGLGIPARDLDRIFERFYRVDRARSRQTGGTGLGLAIVRHVAQNHGGDVTVQSVEGQGSTFTMRVAAE